MQADKENTSFKGLMVLTLIFINAIVVKVAFLSGENWYWLLVVTLPLLLMSVYTKRKRKRTVIQNYPRIGSRRVTTKKQKTGIKLMLLEQSHKVW